MSTDTNFEQLFENLVIEQSSEPLPPITRPSRSSVPNPFGPALALSLQHSTPYSIYVPADAVQRAVSLINGAARKMDCGVRVVPNIKRNDKGQILKGEDGKVVYLAETKGENKGKVLVRFQANENRKQVARFAVVKDGELFAVKDRQGDNGKGVLVKQGMEQDAAKAEAKRLNKQNA